MKFCLSIALFLLCNSLFAQPIIQWQKSLGGTEAEAAYSIQQTSEGGVILVGVALSNDGDVSGNHGGGDWWAVKLSSLGAIQWQECFGGSSTDNVRSIHQTLDHGYIMAGETYSNDGEVTGNHGGWDYWAIKINTTGNIEWQKTLGGSKGDHGFSAQQTSEGGYIMAGYSVSADGDVSGNHGYADFWVVKLSAAGVIEWQKSLGGSGGGELAYCVRQTTDGGYIVVGESQSIDGDVSGNQGSFDFWVVKMNPLGAIQWQKTFGGNGSDTARSIIQTDDGGFVLVGETGSLVGDVSGNHGLLDYWVVKLSTEGNLEWQKTLGGSDSDWGRSICQAKDGGYVVAGLTYSSDGDVIGGTGADIWLVKLNALGEMQWQKILGGSHGETVNSISPTIDGGYILAGESYSNDGDVSGNHGDSDAWVVKLSPESTPTTAPQPAPLAIYPNPAHQLLSVQLPDSFSTENGDVFPLSIRITDLPGREVMRQTIESEAPLNIKAIPNGLYLLTATTNSGKVVSGKFVKQE